MNVQMTPPAGYNLNWLTTTVTLHKIDTVVDFTSAGVINDPDGNSIRINLSFYVYSTPYAKSIGELTGRVRILTMRGTTVNIDNVTFNDDEEVYFVTISNDAQ
ncbi:hypothetical protein FACS1894218_5780 [Bacilli bacterium]|nr:hypothetical protein FACS1894218_5780 [Bacilli bacterium]